MNVPLVLASGHALDFLEDVIAALCAVAVALVLVAWRAFRPMKQVDGAGSIDDPRTCPQCKALVLTAARCTTCGARMT